MTPFLDRRVTPWVVQRKCWTGPSTPSPHPVTGWGIKAELGGVTFVLASTDHVKNHSYEWTKMEKVRKEKKKKKRTTLCCCTHGQWSRMLITIWGDPLSNSTHRSGHPLMLALSNCIKHHTISVMAISFGLQRPMYIHCGQVVYTAQVEERNFDWLLWSSQNPTKSIYTALQNI